MLVAKPFDVHSTKEQRAKGIQFFGHNQGAINQSSRRINPSLDGIITVRAPNPKEVIQKRSRQERETKQTFTRQEHAHRKASNPVGPPDGWLNLDSLEGASLPTPFPPIVV